MIRCSRRDCFDAGTHFPIIYFWAAGFSRDTHPALEAFIRLPFCPAHALRLGVSDLLTDEGWRSIEATFALMGLSRPDRTNAVIEIRRVEEMPAVIAIKG